MSTIRSLSASLVLAALCASTLPGQNEPAARTGDATKGLAADLAWLCDDVRKGRGSANSLEVARWLEGKFKQAGLAPLFDGSHLRGFRTLRWRGFNVGGILPGRHWPADRRHVIVSAHHDHLGVRKGKIYPGASDNAAGVAAMLHVMRTLVRRKELLEHTVVFLAFDREEVGLMGSRHYARYPALPLEQTVAFTTMDILGREFMNLKGARLVVMGAEHAPELAEVADASRFEGLELVFVGTDVIGDRSDYAPFRNRKVPYLFFSSGENRDYHKTGDTVMNLDIPLLALQARFVTGVIERLASLTARPKFRELPVTHPRELASLEKVLKDLAKGPDRILRDAVPGIRARLEKARLTGPQKLTNRTLLKTETRRLLLLLRRTWKTDR